MIDIHTHILPDLDDGALDIYDTLEMAAMAVESGTTVVAATPHCNIPGVFDNYFGSRFCDTFEYAREILRKEVPDLKLVAGMEVFATERLPRLLTEGKIFPINRTRYILIEFGFEEDPGFADSILKQVSEVRAIPVIAHAERYEFIQEDPAIAYEWKKAGYEIQVNKGSFVGRFGRRAWRTAYELLNHNLVTAVASDAHGPAERTTYMADVFEHLKNEYPKRYLDTLFEVNPGRICNGLKPVSFRRIPFEEDYNEYGGRKLAL